MSYPDYPSNALISKLKTYYPKLKETSVPDVDNAFMCVIGGFKEIFADNLRRIRGKFMMNQTTASSDIFGVSYSSYSAWENAKAIPRVANFKEGCKKLGVDPAEFISINPVSAESVFEKKVPLLAIPFLRGKPFAFAFRDFEDSERKKELQYIPVEEYGKYDYAIEIDKESFPADDFLLNYKAIVYCSWKEFAGIDPIQQMKIANGKLALVAIVYNKFSLRKIRFDNEFLTLEPINKTEPEYIFPMDLKYIEKMKEPEKSEYLGIETLAANVQIYGLVKNIKLNVIDQ